MNSSFPNRWSFSYIKFTKYVTNIVAEPKYKYGQQEQVTVRNYNRRTALERSVFSASIMPQNIQLFGPREGFLTHQWIITGNKQITDKYYDEAKMWTQQKRVATDLEIPGVSNNTTGTLEQKSKTNS